MKASVLVRQWPPETVNLAWQVAWQGVSSAGGGHAAALAIAVRDRGEVPVIFQVLVYPMLDDRTGSSTAVSLHIGTLVWSRESNRSGWEALLG